MILSGEINSFNKDRFVEIISVVAIIMIIAHPSIASYFGPSIGFVWAVSTIVA